MYALPLALLTIAATQLAPAQDVSGAALLNSSFFEFGGHSPLTASPGRNVRLAVDSTGNRYILWSWFGILTLVPHQGSTYGYRGFVLKVAPDNRVVWEYAVTYERYTSERLTSLTVDPAGNLTIAGARTTGNATEGFVRRLDTTGSGGVTTALWNVPVSGSPTSIASDALGNLYVTGTADPNFQTTPGAAKPSVSETKCTSKLTAYPCPDAFVLKLSPDGQRTIYATRLGGSEIDTAWDIAVGPDGSAYVAGETTSPDFPTTPGAAQRAWNGTTNLGTVSYGDGFAVRIDPLGRSFLYSTYLGSAGPGALFAIALDRTTGNALVAGRTEARDSIPGSQPDTLIALLNPTGGLVRSNRIETPGIRDWAVSASVSPEGRLFAGISGSGDILELSPRTLTPIRRTCARSYRPPDVIAQTNGVVNIASGSGGFFEGVFAVPPGQSSYGSVYFAQYDFNSPARPNLTTVVNAASYLRGQQFGDSAIAVAPNELVTIFGEAMPAPVRVTLNGRSLPILYASETQINTLIPGDMPLVKDTELKLETGPTIFAAYPADVTRVAPAFFIGATGVAAINQDGTINSREHPAPPGSVIALFGTGLGRLTPQGLLVEPIEVYGPGGPGGMMEVLYAGAAPGLPGVQQVNVRIHPGTPVGASPSTALIQLHYDKSVGPERTQSPVSIWIGAP